MPRSRGSTLAAVRRIRTILEQDFAAGKTFTARSIVISDGYGKRLLTVPFSAALH
jgi:hypothetical protein